jgi:hypothetical protein
MCKDSDSGEKISAPTCELRPVQYSVTISCQYFKGEKILKCLIIWRDQNMWRTLQNSVVAVRHMKIHTFVAACGTYNHVF